MMIEFGELIGQLRRELQDAMAEGANERLRFEVGPVELEATVAVERSGGGGTKVRFWVIELGGDGKLGNVTTQRIKLTLQPRIGETGQTAYVSGDSTPNER